MPQQNQEQLAQALAGSEIDDDGVLKEAEGDKEEEEPREQANEV